MRGAFLFGALALACFVGSFLATILYHQAREVSVAHDDDDGEPIGQRSHRISTSQTSQIQRSSVAGEKIVSQPPQKATNFYPAPAPLGNLQQFQFVNNEDLCKEDQVFMVILVDSAPSHVDHRIAIRSSYASVRIPGIPIVTVFLVGKPSTASEQALITAEIQAHHDILQGDHVDHYRNQSYSDLMGMRWVNLYCPQARFILKTDDDTFFDLYQLVDILHNTFRNLKSFMACVLIRKGAMVFRDPSVVKWYMSPAEHKSDMLDPYCIASSFIFTPAMASQIDNAALTEHEGISINDVFLTGVLMRVLKVQHHTLDDFFTLDQNYWHNWAASNPTTLTKYVFAPFPGGNLELARKLTHIMQSLAEEYALPRLKRVYGEQP